MTTIPQRPPTFGDIVEHDKGNPTVAALALDAVRRQAAHSLVLSACWPMNLEFFVGDGVVAWWAVGELRDDAEAGSVHEDRRAFVDRLREKYGPIEERVARLSAVLIDR